MPGRRSGTHGTLGFSLLQRFSFSSILFFLGVSISVISDGFKLCRTIIGEFLNPWVFAKV
jgi:hypothetical protein